MASRSTGKGRDGTILTIGVVLICGFLAYKLWPAIRAKLQGGGSSGGGGAVGGVGGGEGYGGYPQQGQGQGSGSGAYGAVPGLNNGSGGGGSLTSWLSGILNAGYNTAAGDNALSSDYLPGEDPLAQLDDQGLPLEQTSYSDPDQYLITQDVPGSDGADYTDSAGDYNDDAYDPYVEYPGDGDQQETNYFDGSGTDYTDNDYLY
jgi:hypothetical protein